MRKALILFFVLVFILWILPLGVFIKPSQEKSVCGGQRAICMCHAFVAKPDKAMEHGISLSTGGTSNAENASGAGPYFVFIKPTLGLNLWSISFLANQSFSYQSPYLAVLESVPKV